MSWHHHVIYTFQTAGRQILETVFPCEATAQLPEEDVSENAATMAALKSGSAYQEALKMKLVAGSRSEGLGIDSNWGHEPADIDTMYLYGGCWGVRFDDLGSDHGSIGEEYSGLSIHQGGLPPCYCRVASHGDTWSRFCQMAQIVSSTNSLAQLMKSLWLDVYGIMSLDQQVSFPSLVFPAVLLIFFHRTNPIRQCETALFAMYSMMTWSQAFSQVGAFCVTPLVFFAISRP